MMTAHPNEEIKLLVGKWATFVFVVGGQGHLERVVVSKGDILNHTDVSK